MKRARPTQAEQDARARASFLEHTWVRPLPRRALVNLARVSPIQNMDMFKSWLPVVGDGSIETRPSTIPGAGRGLFATRSFVAGEVVTYYGGPVARMRPVASIPRRQRSHLRVLVHYRWLLVGDAPSARLGEPGTPGGALMNHATTPNVEFVNIDSAANEARAMAGSPDAIDPFDRLVVARALQGISPGDEFLVDYGGPYWKREDVHEDDDEPEVEFDYVDPAPAPPSPSTEPETPAPKRRRMAPTPITGDAAIRVYADRRCDVCLVRAVTHVWPTLGLYCCQTCLDA